MFEVNEENLLFNCTNGSISIEYSQSQIINLVQGWSGISSYLDPTNPDIQELMTPLDELIIIQNLGEFYQPGNIGSTLSEWYYKSGYYIKTTDESQLFIEGQLPVSKTLNLTIGWNLIPVLSNQPINISSLFSGQIGKIEIIKEAIGLNMFWPTFSINSLDHLHPGKSYLVKMNQSATITFD